MEAPELRVKTNLSKLLKDRRLSVIKLSSLAQVPHKTIYHWLTGQAPGVVGLYKVSRVLGVSLEDLAFAGQEAEESHIGPWLKKCRERVRMTQLEAAQKVQMAWLALELIEAGEADPDIVTIVTLATHYQVSPSVLTAKLKSMGKSGKKDLRHLISGAPLIP